MLQSSPGTSTCFQKVSLFIILHPWALIELDGWLSLEVVLADPAHARLCLQVEVLLSHRILRTEAVLHYCYLKIASFTITPKGKNENRKLVGLAHDRRPWRRRSSLGCL